MKEKARQTGREIRFGIRLHVIVRETEEQAWKAADELIQHVDEEAVKSAQKYFLEWIQKVKTYERLASRRPFKFRGKP